MNISDIQRCADFFQEHYLKTFYLVITYDGKSFILIGEKTNFPHLMGIQNRTYKSNGYNRPQHLFNDIIGRNPVSTAIIPNNISTTSKMYKKILNFTNSTDIFWKNHGPLAINYNPTFSNSKLNHVDVLLADLPCSGLGIMGRKNDIKYQMTEEQLGELAALQRQILSVVWKYVKPGGQMIFSTCTLNKGENAENIKWIEENTPLHLVSIEEYLPQNLKNRTGSQGYLQLIPGEDTCDGFFISKFKRPEAK